MGLFGGSKSNANTTNTETTFANYNTGKGPSANFNLSGVGGGKGSATSVSIQTSDYGAIEAGRSLALASIESSGQAFRDYAEQLGQTTQSVLSKSLDVAKANQTPEASQLLDTLKQLGIGLVIAFVAAKVISR